MQWVASHGPHEAYADADADADAVQVVHDGGDSGGDDGDEDLNAVAGVP